MPQPTTRNKTRKRRSQRRRPNRGQEASAAMRTQSNRSAKHTRRSRARTRVTEMPEEQAKARSKRVGEQGAVIVSPTGTKHRPIKRKVPRLARSRAKSPAIGRQKEGRTAKARRAQSGRADQRAGIGRRAQ
jgi:hypothetical protein